MIASDFKNGAQVSIETRLARRLAAAIALDRKQRRAGRQRSQVFCAKGAKLAIVILGHGDEDAKDASDASRYSLPMSKFKMTSSNRDGSEVFR